MGTDQHWMRQPRQPRGIPIGGEFDNMAGGGAATVLPGSFDEVGQAVTLTDDQIRSARRAGVAFASFAGHEATPIRDDAWRQWAAENLAATGGQDGAHDDDAGPRGYAADDWAATDIEAAVRDVPWSFPEAETAYTLGVEHADSVEEAMANIDMADTYASDSSDRSRGLSMAAEKFDLSRDDVYAAFYRHQEQTYDMWGNPRDGTPRPTAQDAADYLNSLGRIAEAEPAAPATHKGHPLPEGLGSLADTSAGGTGDAPPTHDVPDNVVDAISRHHYGDYGWTLGHREVTVEDGRTIAGLAITDGAGFAVIAPNDAGYVVGFTDGSYCTYRHDGETLTKTGPHVEEQTILLNKEASSPTDAEQA